MHQTALVTPFDLGDWIRERIRTTPWWALSLAFHALLIATATLVTISERAVAGGDAPEVIRVAQPPPPRVVLPEKWSGFTGDDRSPETPEAPPSEEKPIYFPEADLGDHIQYDVGKDGDTALGESLEFLSSLPGEAGGRQGTLPGRERGVSAPIGVGDGNGGAGRYGTRTGAGRRNLNVGGGGLGTEAAVLSGLRWLARHQGQDGGWHAEGFATECAPGTPCGGPGYSQFDAGLTGLALLAFLGAGHTHLSRERYEDPFTHKRVSVGECVRRGIDYLRSVQDGDGCFGPRTGEFMYNHAIAALAIAEAYGLTNAAQIRPAAQRAIDFVGAAQNPYRGWRYTVRPGDNDTSVTGWCVMALKSAAIAGLAVPQTGFDGARAWIDSVTTEEGEVGYTGKGKTDVFVRGKNEHWSSAHPSMTAVGLLCRIFIDADPGDRRLEKHASRIVKDLPRFEMPAAERPVDFYYWYYATLALYQYDAPEGRYWKAWNEAMKTALVRHQKKGKDGCEAGSWDPSVDRWGFAGGRVYATAINVLTLEVYYRYDRLFGSAAARRR